MNINVKNLNEYFNTPDKMYVIMSSNRKPISMAYLESAYGYIQHKFLGQDPGYTLKYKNYEVDVDYSSNELSDFINIKAALYRRDEIIGFKTLEVFKAASSLRDGIIKICEEMISEKCEA